MAIKLFLASVVTLSSGAAFAQSADRLAVGIYAPSVEFGTAQARLTYVQGLAKAIGTSTGLRVEAQSYASLAALKKDNVDFAIIEGQCVATNLGWKLVATANIGGTSRPWALFTSGAADLPGLKGKKLAVINTGCNDAGFVDNAMLEGEVDPSHFGARVGKLDLNAAVAEVASYKTAQAVFAPTSAGKGLTKLFDTGSVPNPAFVVVGAKLGAGQMEKVSAAVLGYSGGAGISGWVKPERNAYATFAARLSRVTKAGVLVAPELVRLDAKEVIAEPATLNDTATIDARHHFVRSPNARME